MKSTRSQQTSETKKIIARYKKILKTVSSEKEQKRIIEEASILAKDSIQQQKIIKSLVNFI